VRSRLRPFPLQREKLQAPNGRGVYVIYNGRGRVVHVGRTPKARGGIAQRLKDHMAAASSFTLKYLKGKGAKLRGAYHYRCLVVANARHRALLEAYTTGRLCPAHIGLG
jgi:hypothetical protein